MNQGRSLPLLTPLIAASALGCSPTVTSEDWRLDLRLVESKLEERHSNLYHTGPQRPLSAAFDDLEEGIPAVSPPGILVGMAPCVAMVGDGQTSFYLADLGR